MLDLIKAYKVVSIIGLEKNVGKTTTLNYIIEKTKGIYSLGLTSIGRDGETIDRVTSTEKPRIYGYKGTVIATARQCLANSDITKEIVNKTKIHTPMGEIIIIRALSDGYVEIAGPSVTKELEVVTSGMLDANAELVLIDGALSRKSLASPGVAEATILATGAAVSKSMSEVIDKTVHAYELLNLPEVEGDIKEILDRLDERVSIIFKEEDVYRVKNIDVPTALGIDAEVLSEIMENTTHLFIKGAITDRFIDMLVRRKGTNSILKLVVEDGTKLFLNKDSIRRLESVGIVLVVLRKINVIAVTINPSSPYGYSFDGDSFMIKLKEKLKIPVYNVKGGKHEIS
ncbi:MAG: hypothetical protein ACRDA4_06235 [Filifactoraceae bacterium]